MGNRAVPVTYTHVALVVPVQPRTSPFGRDKERTPATPLEAVEHPSCAGLPRPAAPVPRAVAAKVDSLTFATPDRRLTAMLVASGFTPRRCLSPGTPARRRDLTRPPSGATCGVGTSAFEYPDVDLARAWRSSGPAYLAIQTHARRIVPRRRSRCRPPLRSARCRSPLRPWCSSSWGRIQHDNERTVDGVPSFEAANSTVTAESIAACGTRLRPSRMPLFSFLFHDRYGGTGSDSAHFDGLPANVLNDGPRKAMKRSRSRQRCREHTHTHRRHRRRCRGSTLAKLQGIDRTRLTCRHSRRDPARI
jgi:hypothetical protein